VHNNFFLHHSNVKFNIKMLFTIVGWGVGGVSEDTLKGLFFLPLFRQLQIHSLHYYEKFKVNII
jgi:hypothetical protein